MLLLQLTLVEEIRMKRKFLFTILGIILTIALVTAAVYQEPWSADVDAGGFNLNNVNNVTANNFLGNLSGNMDWDNLQNYPAACPGSSAITTLGDSVTCSDLWVDAAGDNMTGALWINATSETDSQLTLGPGISAVGLAVPGITIGATSGNVAIILGLDGSNFATISWEDLATDYLKIDTGASNRKIRIQQSGGLLDVGGALNVTGNLTVNEYLFSNDWT